jgi:hypothetical protein
MWKNNSKWYPNRVNYCVIFVVYTQLMNVICGPGVGDPSCRRFMCFIWQREEQLNLTSVAQFKSVSAFSRRSSEPGRSCVYVQKKQLIFKE